MKKPLHLLTLILLALSTSKSLGAPTASIDQLNWMTGSWSGSLGPNTLEENWTTSEGKSLMASVRTTGHGSTSMFETITIEEVDGTLILHLQQWESGFKPRTAGPMRMELTEITHKSVSFRNVAGFGMPTLKYSHPDADTFIVHVGMNGGGTFDIRLKAKNI